MHCKKNCEIIKEKDLIKMQRITHLIVFGKKYFQCMVDKSHQFFSVSGPECDTFSNKSCSIIFSNPCCGLSLLD
jgi:hypothetical protein